MHPTPIASAHFPKSCQPATSIPSPARSGNTPPPRAPLAVPFPCPLKPSRKCHHHRSAISKMQLKLDVLVVERRLGSWIGSAISATPRRLVIRSPKCRCKVLGKNKHTPAPVWAEHACGAIGCKFNAARGRSPWGLRAGKRERSQRKIPAPATLKEGRSRNADIIRTAPDISRTSATLLIEQPLHPGRGQPTSPAHQGGGDDHNHNEALISQARTSGRGVTRLLAVAPVWRLETQIGSTALAGCSLLGRAPPLFIQRGGGAGGLSRLRLSVPPKLSCISSSSASSPAFPYVGPIASTHETKI